MQSISVENPSFDTSSTNNALSPKSSTLRKVLIGFGTALFIAGCVSGGYYATTQQKSAGSSSSDASYDLPFDEANSNYTANAVCSVIFLLSRDNDCD